MVRHHPSRRFLRFALAGIVLAISAALMPAQAVAAELGDYLWQHRPLLVFAPNDNDPRLVETMRRIEASRCDFADRDMVLGRMVTESTSEMSADPGRC